MSVASSLFDFKIDRTAINQGARNAFFTATECVLKSYLQNLKSLDTYDISGMLMKVYSFDNSGHILAKIYSDGLVTLNIEYLKDSQNTLSFEVCKKIENDILHQVTDINKSFTFVPIKRGSFMRYFPTSDDRLLEYDIEEVLFEEQSPYQKVQIVHSKSIGNMLVLDGLQNISEADLIYTESLMARGKENYKDKEVLILGGGDGALLYELLKENPNEVIMLEIDDIVIKACAKHMRSICGDVLDHKTGPNYSIILGDCMVSLQKYIKEGRKFDYIFGDLTDVPISSDDSDGYLWDLICKILQISFELLRPNGKFMTHLTGSASQDALKKYDQQVMKVNNNAKIVKSCAFVPSFFEEWVFAQISVETS